jgi:hypothetical protein
MPDVTNSAAEVGQMLVQALQNTFGMSPEAAIAQAQADTGVSDSQLANVDLGQAFDFAAQQPGLTPETHSYLQNASSNFNATGNVDQSGSSFNGNQGGGNSGGSGFGGSGGSGGAAAASNAQIVQQVTSNFNLQEINDNHIDILGNVNGDIDIDQDNDDIHDIGDGNAINTGDGDQTAATGDHSSIAQSEFGNAVSNTGDGAVTAGDDVDLDHSAVGDNNTIIDDSTDVDAFDSNVNTGSGDITDVDALDSNVNTGNGDLINNDDGNVATDGSSILDNRGGIIDNSVDNSFEDNSSTSIDDHSADRGGVSLDNSDGSIDDSSLGFGSGNVQGDVQNEEGAANSQGGNATGNSTDVNVLSDVNEEHGPGDLNDVDFGKGSGPIHETISHPLVAESTQHEEPQHEAAQHEVPVHAEVAIEEPQHVEALQEEPQHLTAEVDTHDAGADHAADHVLDDHAIG